MEVMRGAVTMPEVDITYIYYGSYLNEDDLLNIKNICEALQKDTMLRIDVKPICDVSFQR